MLLPYKKMFLWITTILLLFSSLGSFVHPVEGYIKINIDTLPYKQEITLPIDTSLETAKFQPIDIRIAFNNPCWGTNETINSIRVGIDDGTGIQEIESQVYDLEYSDDTHIKTCSLVFLIPDETNGKEKYYVLYDSKETTPASYQKHITVEDTHYFYEPIPGQKIDFDYYGIRQDGFVVYAVIQKGELLGNPIALASIKFKPNSTTVETYNVDQLGNFDFRYGIKGEIDYIGSSWASDIKKTVLVDGNLMIRLRLGCISPRGDIQSDNIYTYYYSPTTTKRILVDAHHEILKTINIDDPTTLDGVYCGITSIKSRSASIEKMNVGEILPSVYIYGEDNTIHDFSVPENPESSESELVLSTQDDMELGVKGWVCLGDAVSGKVHGIIFESNTGIVNASDDGIQIKVYAKQNIKLPGLEADTGNLELTRNAYENGNHQTIIDQGRIFHYKIEFLTVETGGYVTIDNESTFYQKLINDVPVYRGNTTQEQEKERYNLTVYVHFARSVPLGSLLSAALGKNISYIYAELYQQNSFRSSGSVGRLSLGSIELNMTGKSLLEKIQTIFGIFDWKNLSFFKKIRFPDLDPGIYLVKIFRENPRFAEQHQYIGFGIVNLTENTDIKISCRLQGVVAITLSDQEGNGVKDARCILQIDNTVIADSISDSDGKANLFAPCYSFKPYQLKVFYQGFLIDEEPVTLKILQRFIDLKKSFSLERYNLNLKVTDTWNFPPAVEVNPTLLSDEMIIATTLRGEVVQAGEYVFSNLLPASYRLSMSYKGFRLENNFTLEKGITLDLQFPAEFSLNFSIFNSYANRVSSGSISLERNGKTMSTSIEQNGMTSANVPPGDYEIFVRSDDKVIAQQQIQVRGEKSMEIVTTQDSFLHIVVYYLGFLVMICSLVVLIWKRKIDLCFKFLTIGLLLIILVSPWWTLNGEQATTSTTTNTYIVPPEIITLTTSSKAIGGEISAVPDDVTMVLSLLSLLTVLAGLIIFIGLLIMKRLRKTMVILSILSIVILVVSLIIFVYAFSQLTQVGVGSFMGGGNLDVSIPGGVEEVTLSCSWGPGIGFYLLIPSLILLFLTLFINKIKNKYF